MFSEILEILFALQGNRRQNFGKICLLIGLFFLAINEFTWATEGNPFLEIWINSDTYLIVLFIFACLFLQYDFKENSKIAKFFGDAYNNYLDNAFPKLQTEFVPTPPEVIVIPKTVIRRKRKRKSSK